MRSLRFLILLILCMLSGCTPAVETTNSQPTAEASATEIPATLTPTNTDIPPSPTETVTPSKTSLPYPVVLSVAAGESHSCALISNGAVQCWGKNVYGQLGDGTLEDRDDPVLVEGLEDAQAIAAGWGHTCAVTSAGAVFCWGYNDNGELGDGTTEHSSVPVEVSGVSGAGMVIAAGDDHTCVATEAGMVQCWGFNETGQLGDGSTDNQNSAVWVANMNGVQSLAAGWGHTCALTEAGSVYCWGSNEFGQLGVHTQEDDMPTPIMVDSLSEWVTALTAKGGHTCALITTGEVKCWGVNTYGQLGDGSIEDRDRPSPVRRLRGAQAVAAGWNHTCAILNDGEINCWGWNYYGQLGDQIFMTRAEPISAGNLQGRVSAMWLGWRHTCAVTISGQINCWGENDNGEGWNDWLLAQTPIPELLLNSSALAVVQEKSATPEGSGSSSTASSCPPMPTPSGPSEGQFIGLVIHHESLEGYGYRIGPDENVREGSDTFRIAYYRNDEGTLILIEREICKTDDHWRYTEVVAEFFVPPLEDREYVRLTCRFDSLDKQPDFLLGTTGYNPTGADWLSAKQAWVLSLDTMEFKRVPDWEIWDVICTMP